MDCFCLFGVFRPTRVFFTDLESSPLPVKGCTFWPMLGTCELWGFFSVSHLLWHGTVVYNVHLRGPMTLTPNAECFGSGAVTTCFNDLGISHLGFILFTFLQLCWPSLKQWHNAIKTVTSKVKTGQGANCAF